MLALGCGARGWRPSERSGETSGIGPQPHPGFIEVFGDAALRDGYRQVERVGEKATAVLGNSPVTIATRPRSPS
jgi:hypothetical protein